MSHTIPCPGCGGQLVLRYSPEYQRRYYRCENAPICTYGVSADVAGKPLGRPADHQTRQARIRAHRVFDTFWQGRRWSRRDAYLWLSQQMTIPPQKCHIGQFSVSQCLQAITVVEREERRLGLEVLR